VGRSHERRYANGGRQKHKEATEAMLKGELGTVCSLCGEPLDFTLARAHFNAATLDHVIPLSRGGTNDIDNLRAAHRSCNEQRGSRRAR
jgi:5-methylcytosine-specific restriction endonuclease McrA